MLHCCLIECRFIERKRFSPSSRLGEWDYQQILRKLVKKCLAQSGKMKKLCMKFQDILQDRRKFYPARLDTFREDWTFFSSKGNSLVSADIEVAHWTVRLTLSRHYKDSNVQINTYDRNAPINVFSQKGCGGDTLGLDQQKSLPREFDRTLWHRNVTLDSLVWDYWRHNVWPDILNKIKFCSALKAHPGDFWHTLVTHG